MKAIHTTGYLYVIVDINVDNRVLGPIPLLISAGCSLFLHRKYLVSSAKYLADYTLAVEAKTANLPK